MRRKDELIRRVKNLAVTPSDYRSGKTLLEMMDYYNVNSLMELTEEQMEAFLNGYFAKGANGSSQENEERMHP